MTPRIFVLAMLIMVISTGTTFAAKRRPCKNCGPRVLVKRGNGYYWHYGTRIDTNKGVCASGKCALKGIGDAVEATAETVGEAVVGVGALAVDAGKEVIDRVGCAGTCLIAPQRKSVPCKARTKRSSCRKRWRYTRKCSSQRR